MLRKIVLSLLSCLVPLLPALAVAAPFAYIPNSATNNVSVIDTATNTVTATVGVGFGPYGVAVNPAGTFAYVANYRGNTVSVINTASNSVTATVGVGSHPYALGNFIGPDLTPATPVPTLSQWATLLLAGLLAAAAIVAMRQRMH